MKLIPLSFLKPIECILSVTVATLACLSGEEVTAFKPEDVRLSSVIGKVKPKDRKPGLQAYQAGERIGGIETGKAALADLVEKALSEDQSEAPFFGPGYKFILCDSKEQHFIVFLEYEKGHETFNGFRAAIAPLNVLRSKGAVLVGDPYQGVTFDKELLKQLKAIADRLPEEKEEGKAAERGKQPQE
jgi:hypothetical protein